jgi:peptidoglycan/LPS O-acetylase OafA/YrhL
MVRFIPSLESARGLAALMVCLFHAGDLELNGQPALAQTSIWRLPLNGHGAVVLFFVLSGFVLRLSLERRAAEPPLVVAAEYIVARAFRLFPVIIATILLIAALAVIVRGEWISTDVVLLEALLLDKSLNPPFWTLQVEVFGSLLILLAFLIEKRFGIWPVVAMTVGLLPLSFLGWKATVGQINTGLFYTFLCGYLVAVLPRSPPGWSRYLPWIICAALIAAYAAHARVQEGYPMKQWWLIVTTIGASLIVYVLSDERYRNALQMRPVRLLGFLSYSFYALHLLGLDLAQFTVEKLDLHNWVGVVLLMVLGAGATFLMAITMTYLVERPAIALGRHISFRRRDPAAVTLQQR